MKHAHSTYKQINSMSMSQLDLILMVYRGTINLLEQARKHFDENNTTAAYAACEKARKCIVHLYTTLDMEKGEAIAAQLGHLYAFMIQRIDMAMSGQGADKLDEIIKLLTTIKEGWDGLKTQESKGKAVPAAAPGEIKNPTTVNKPEGQKRVTFSA